MKPARKPKAKPLKSYGLPTEFTDSLRHALTPPLKLKDIPKKRKPKP